MSATQAKVVAEIKRIAAEAKLDADFEWSWGNVGQVYFRRGFETVANAHLDFQGAYLTAALRRGTDKAQFFGSNDTRHRVDYARAVDFAAFFAAVQAAVAPAPAAKRPRAKRAQAR